MSLRLNLASGTDIRDGWVNMDVVPKWPIARRGCDIVWDARTDPLPFRDNAVEEIYAGYLLLHLAPVYHERVLQEIRRVLSPSGVVQFGEVDMQRVMERYLADPSNPSIHNLIWGEQGKEHGVELAAFDKHCCGFTEQTLRDTLDSAGFDGMERTRIHCAEVWYELTMNAHKAVRPFISVLVPTMRVGGLDILFQGLEQQTYRNFELVLVDGIHDRRAAIVEKMSEKFSFPVRHVAPIDNPFPINAFCRYANTALVHASGEIALHFVDYTYTPKDILARHARFHREHGREHGLMGPHDYYCLPAINKSFPGYKHEEIQNYCRDLSMGKLQPVMWSLFDESVDFSKGVTLGLDPVMGGADPKLRMNNGAVDQLAFHAKNESVALEALVDLNGWDEKLDETHCLDPNTPVLCSDIQWRPLGDVAKGDLLVGFDEQSSPRSFRKYREATVEAVIRSTRPAQRVIMESGREITTTQDHRWLCMTREGRIWKSNLKVGDHLLLMLAPRDPFVADDEYMRGYIGGMTAGDGTVHFADNGMSRDSLGRQPYWRVALTDEEPLLRLKQYLLTFGVNVSIADFDGGPGSKLPLQKVETRGKENLRVIKTILGDRRRTPQYRRGYLAGFYDAEGCDGNSLTITQSPGATFDYVYEAVESLGFDFHKNLKSSSSKGVIDMRLSGEASERLRFYAETVPSMARKKRWWCGVTMNTIKEEIVAIENIGTRDVVDIQTSTRTFVANGYATHNCYQDSDIADRLTKKKGINWTVDPSMAVRILNPRHVFPFPLRLRPYETNKKIWEASRDAGYPDVNKWSIREARAKACTSR
jgi:hypothetical protein